jgi:hypothetical protein
MACVAAANFAHITTKVGGSLLVGLVLGVASSRILH